MQRFILLVLFLWCTILYSQVSNPRMPAEWEETQAVVMEFAYNRTYPLITCDVAFDPYIKVAEACIRENVAFYIYQPEGKKELGEKYVQLDTIFSNRGIHSDLIHIIPVDQKQIPAAPWARDHGLFCVYQNEVGPLQMYHFGGDYLSTLVDEQFGLVSTEIPYGIFDGYLCDGGNMMTDGHGTFNIMRDFKTDIKEGYGHFKSYFGINKSVLIDFFDVHIDYLMKIVNEETLLVAYLPDENFGYEQYNEGQQQDIDKAVTFIKEHLRSAFGREITIYPIQNAPAYNNPSYNNTTITGVASYTNALILNKTVLVPQYACLNYQPDTDAKALEIYRKAMPGYTVVGVDCSQFQVYGGSIHCITHEVPAADPIYIKHKWLKGFITSNNAYLISTQVKSARGIDKVQLFWRINNEEKFRVLNLINKGGDIYETTIPVQPKETTIHYYIKATDRRGKSVAKPMVGAVGAYSFVVKGDLTDVVETFSDKMYCHYSISKNWLEVSGVPTALFPLNISIYNISGEQILREQLMMNRGVDLTSFGKGLYLLIFEKEGQTIWTKKILIP